MNPQAAAQMATFLTIVAVALGVVYNSRHVDRRFTDLKEHMGKRFDDLRDLMKAEFAR